MLVIGFRRVCSVHLQRLWRISSSAGCFLVRFQSSLLLMASGHRIRGILSKAGVDECLDLLQCRSRESPCFSSIQHDRVYCGVKDPDFDVDGQVR